MLEPPDVHESRHNEVTAHVSKRHRLSVTPLTPISDAQELVRKGQHLEMHIVVPECSNTTVLAFLTYNSTLQPSRCAQSDVKSMSSRFKVVARSPGKLADCRTHL